MQEFPFDELGDLYQKIILDHYRNSRNKSNLAIPDIEYDEFNPICGDQVVLQIKLSAGRIAQACFHGEGCAISQASASILTELLKGKTLEAAEGLAARFRDVMQGRAPSGEDLEKLGDIQASGAPGAPGALGALGALQAVRRFPLRVKCALLAWIALEEGIEQYRVRTSTP